MYITRTQLHARQPHPRVLCAGFTRALIIACERAIDESEIHRALYTLGRYSMTSMPELLGIEAMPAPGLKVPPRQKHLALR